MRALSRRDLLRRAAALTGLAGAGLATLLGCTSSKDPQPLGVFSLGVASGDPTPDGVVLWTRLARFPLAGGGIAAVPQPVEWRLAEDPELSTVVRSGIVMALPEEAHTVHVEVQGLAPARCIVPGDPWAAGRGGALSAAAKRHGKPKTIRVDNGPEFVSRVLDQWAYWNKVELDFSRPGKPTDNAFIESFNGRLRAECLNISGFLSLPDARNKLDAWRKDYNEARPHSALGNLTPSQYASMGRENPGGETGKVA